MSDHLNKLIELIDDSGILSSDEIIALIDESSETDLPRDDDRMPIKALISLARKDFNDYGKNDDWVPWCQSVSLTRFFVNARSKKHRAILTDYLMNLRLILDEYKQEEEKESVSIEVPKNEEEEERFLEERRKRIEERERSIVDRAVELTFAGWDAGDWKSLERAFGKSL